MTPLILPANAATPDAPLWSVPWAFSTFLSSLERHGVVWSDFPDDFREVGALNTSCGGHRSNGSRTSLRNLVMLEGLDFTRLFLSAAKRGAERIGWTMRRNVFDAELAWLDQVGEDAPRLLDDRNIEIPELDEASEMFSEARKLSEDERLGLLSPLPDDLREAYMRAASNDKYSEDGHYARIFIFVMGHPGLCLVPPDDGDTKDATLHREIARCAALIRAS